MKDRNSPNEKVRDLSFKMDLLAFPEEIVALIFEEVGNFRYYKTSRECVLNVMLANKLCYSIGLPILYRDVMLKYCYHCLEAPQWFLSAVPDSPATLSFFRALPDYGRYVRRLHLNGICNQKTNQHILSVDQLTAIARYCGGLRAFLLSYECLNCSECSCDTIQTCIPNNLLQQFSKLEVWAPGHWCPEIPLNLHLKQIRFGYGHELSPGLLRAVASGCPELIEMHFTEVWPLTYQEIVDSLRLLPRLEVFQIHDMNNLYLNEVPEPSQIFNGLLETLASQNRFLHTLVLGHVYGAELFPNITTTSFPCLRFLAITGRYRERSPENEPPSDLVDFLRNLKSLEIVRLDEEEIGFGKIGSTICDYLPETVRVQTLMCYNWNIESYAPGVGERFVAGRVEEVHPLSPETVFESDDFMMFSRL